MPVEKEKILSDAVLVFPVKGSKVLLATKMKKIGRGKLNGYGGGIEKGELPIIAVLRETEEESRESKDADGVTLMRSQLEKFGFMSFHNQLENGETFICNVHIYLCSAWTGEFFSSEEMINPTWYSKERIPLTKLMPADRFWLPQILAGHKITGKAKYGPHQNELIGKVEIEKIMCFADDVGGRVIF